MDTTGGIGEKADKKTKGIGKKTRKKIKTKPFLPDDIIPNILCRLPAKTASQCRIVCSTWRDITLTRNFVDLHFQYSLPMIIVVNLRFDCLAFDHILLDKWWEPARRMLMIHEFPFDHDIDHFDYKAQFSHAGLIVFRDSISLLDVIIHNPMNLEKVTISLSRELINSQIYGVFFHPSLKQYCSLWRIEVFSQSGKSIQYKMLNLGSNPFMKTINNPFPRRVKRCDSDPLFIDKYLYWMLGPERREDGTGWEYSGRCDIMQYDIVGEGFSVKSCPLPLDTRLDSFKTYLLNIDGALSFLVVFRNKITIWRLEDHAQNLWTTTNYTFRTKDFRFIPEPIAVVGGKLALLSRRRLVVCNLVQGTKKCFRKYRSGVSFMSHQMSLASLKDCQSTIYLDDKGEVNVRENSFISHSSSGSNQGLAGTNDDEADSNNLQTS